MAKIKDLQGALDFLLKEGYALPDDEIYINVYEVLQTNNRKGGGDKAICTIDLSQDSVETMFQP